jgi:hypothetical protein
MAGRKGPHGAFFNYATRILKLRTDERASLESALHVNGAWVLPPLQNALIRRDLAKLP